jgi:Domain of unknown function (DUF6985)
VEHPVFGTLESAEGIWKGRVRIEFFSDFDDVASALYVQRFGGFDYNKAPNKGFQQGLFELDVLNHDVDVIEPSSSQQRAFEEFVTNQRPVCTMVLGAIFDHYRANGDRWRSGDETLDAIMVPPVRSADELKRLIRLHRLYVLDLSKNDCALIGFNFVCSWDIEHGLGVLIHGTTLVEIGENDISWCGPSGNW